MLNCKIHFTAIGVCTVRFRVRFCGLVWFGLVRFKCELRCKGIGSKGVKV